MKSIKLTSVYRVINKIKRDFKFLDLEDNDIIEWIGEALDAIGTGVQYAEKVCYRLVSNYQTTLPEWNKALIQILKYNGTVTQSTICSILSSTDDTTSTTTTATTSSNSCCEASEDTSTNVWVSMSDCLYTYAINKGYTDLLNQFSYGQDTTWYPVRLSTDKFFNSRVCAVDNIPEIYSSCRYEYTIIEGDTLRFNFKDGFIALAYLEYQLDENGYPMVPDDYSYLTAIEKYIIMKIFEGEFYAGRALGLQKFQKAELDWHFYVRQAKNKSMLRSYDEEQNNVDRQPYILPRNNMYNSHSSNQSYKQSRNNW